MATLLPEKRPFLLAPKVVLGKLGLLTPKLRIFLENLCRKGSDSGTPENSRKGSDKDSQKGF